MSPSQISSKDDVIFKTKQLGMAMANYYRGCPNYRRCYVVQPVKNVQSGGAEGAIKDVIGVPIRLESITVKSGQVIDSLKFTYTATDGKTRTRGPWGGQGGYPGNNEICLGPREYVMEVSGTIGEYEGQIVVRSLMFVTSNNCTYGPYGDQMNQNVTPFRSFGGKVVGFHGRCGEYLNSIGTYTL
uniref:Jacalin-type lectin domain-containing protein n=1 Tax=Leersia perrieri TaxID=77586 RepID=A0A0D9XAK3_9ORYZ